MLKKKDYKMIKFSIDAMHRTKTKQEVLDSAFPKNISKDLPRIPEFYKDKEIFITGGR